MIKDNSKVILLTIFLYVALNLRTIERFLQYGYIDEPFTATDDNEKGYIIMQGVVKSIMMLLFSIYYIASDEDTSFDISEPSAIKVWIFVTFVIMIWGLVVISTKSTEFYNTTIYIQSFLKPMISFAYIYTVVKILQDKQIEFLRDQ